MIILGIFLILILVFVVTRSRKRRALTRTKKEQIKNLYKNEKGCLPLSYADILT